MLVLSRKAGEAIQIGDRIQVVVRRIAGNRVSIGIEAPDDVRVLRGELEPFATEFDATVDVAEPIGAAAGPQVSLSPVVAH